MKAKSENKIDLEKYWANQATILSHMKRFRLEIDKFREKHKIPKTGVAKSKRHDWYQSYFINPTFNAHEEFGAISDYEILPADKNFIEAIRELADKFNLDSRWYHSLFFLISSGGYKLNPPYSRSVIVSPRFNDVRLPESEQIVTRIHLEIRKDTSIKDIQRIWNKVEECQNKMIGDVPMKRKMIEAKTIEKYVKVRELEDKGKSHAKIAEELGFYIADDVSRFKYELEGRFKPKK